MTTVFVCEDSLDGILTGVYDAWDSRIGHEHVRLSLAGEDTLELFCTYRMVRADLEKAEKVLRTVRRRMGEEAKETICLAVACPSPEKADAVYRLILRGLSMPDGRKAIYYLQDPSVLLLAQLRQKAWHEVHRLYGFLRFEELAGGVLYGRIDPPYAVLPLLAPHFADRFRQENWIIHDIRRGQLAVHRRESRWFLTDAEILDKALLERRSDTELAFQELWRAFCRTIAIEERRNPRCQQNLLPLRFRPVMTEYT